MSLVIAILALWCGAGPASTGTGPFPGRPDPRRLIGREAPALELDRWINSPKLELEELRGRVVLLRWWTDTCPFCAASAPALRELHAKYGERGLTVIGLFHTKPPVDPDLAARRASAAARRFGFDFPIGIDADWRALKRWWLDHYESWTSISFLVDRRGRIRYVHPGGEYHEGDGGDHWPDHGTCNREYRELDATIRTLLEE